MKVKFFYILIGCYYLLFFHPNLILGQNVLEKKTTYSIPLDIDTGFEAEQIQFFEDKGKSYLAILYSTKKLVIYDYKEKKKIKEIRFETEGPNGVGHEVRGFLVVPWEHIYIYSYFERRINVLSMEGEVIQKFKLPDDLNILIPEPSSLCPIIKNKNELIFSGNLAHQVLVEEIIKPLHHLNLETGKHTFQGTSPISAQKFNYLDKHSASFDYNSKEDFFVVSFNASDSIFLFKNNDLTQRYLAKSKVLPEILPISKNKDFFPGKKQYYTYLVGPQYTGIKYDSYRECYYRFAAIGRTWDELNNFVFPEFTLITLDKKFDIIGEQKIPKYSYPSMSFISKEGLHIANQKYYNEISEDELTFDIYKLK